jgi:anhydro-N-acetylmuramic acid kinase
MNAAQPTRFLIGLSVRSGGGAIDCAIVRISGIGLGLTPVVVAAVSYPMPGQLSDWLTRIVQHPDAVSTRHLAWCQRLLGEVCAAAILQTIEQTRLTPDAFQAVGLFDFLAWRDADTRGSTVFELGSAAIVADRTGLTTISDFRASAAAQGGYAGSITAMADALLLSHPLQARTLLRLGGTATVTYLPPGQSPQEPTVHEIAPCNRLLDGFIYRLTNGQQRQDTGGVFAVQGQCLTELLERWLDHPVLNRRGPIQLGSNDFGSAFIEQAIHDARALGSSMHDLLCTVNHFIARAISRAIATRLPYPLAEQRVWLDGGSVRNGLLVRLLADQLGEPTIARLEELGMPADARRPAQAAILAALLLDGVFLSHEGVTGTRRGRRLLGRITPASTGNWSQCLAWQSQHHASLSRFGKAS